MMRTPLIRTYEVPLDDTLVITRAIYYPEPEAHEIAILGVTTETVTWLGPQIAREDAELVTISVLDALMQDVNAREREEAKRWIR